jgi:proteasome regulatory subunit
MNVADEVDFAELADLAAGASGADIKAVCTEAGMYAIRDDRLEVTTADFEQAWRKIQQAEEDTDEVSKTFA